MGHADPSASQTRPAVDTAAAYPPPGRFWEVALGATWTPDERDHVANCPKCREAERRVRGIVAGSEGSTPGSDTATTGRPVSPDTMSSGLDPNGAGRCSAGGSDARTLDPCDATITRSAVEVPGAPRRFDPFEGGPSGTTRTLGRYELLREIGRGGMGVVYQGRDVELNRIVAIKISPALGPADSPRLDRFLREARVAAPLEHPTILPIYEIGQADSTVYIVSRFVDGTDLASLVRRNGPLSCRDAVALVEQIARGAHHAHERGILHRDIKPSNILVDRTGRPFLTDFGLARALDSDHEATITREGVIIGTPAYMAPEQATGQFRRQGPATDVYGLGATLYTLLTGRPPFQAPSAIELLRQVVETDPAPPRRINPAVPRDLDAVSMKALARDPRDRYASALELADDLRRFHDGRSILAHRIGLAGRMLSRARRRPWHATLAVAAVMVAIALLRLASVRSLPESSSGLEPFERGGAMSPEEPGTAPMAPVLLDSERHRTPTEVGTVLAQLKAMTELRRDVAATAEASCLLRLEESGRGLRQQPDDPATRHSLVRETLNLGHIYGTTSRPAEAAQAYRRALAELKALAEQRPARPIYRIELAETYRGLAAALRATGRMAEAAEFDRQAAALTPAGLNPTHVVPNFPPAGRELEADDPDRAAEWLARRPPGLRGWEGYDLKRLGRGAPPAFRGHTGLVFDVAFSPDGRRLASADANDAVKVWDAATGQVVLTLRGHATGTLSIGYSPDGRRLASAGMDGLVKVWDTTSGLEALTLRGHTNPVTSVAYSPDGRRLASGSDDRTVRVWDADAGLEVLILRGHTSSVRGVAFSPDGRRLASAGLDGVVKVWDAPPVDPRTQAR